MTCCFAESNKNKFDIVYSGSLKPDVTGNSVPDMTHTHTNEDHADLTTVMLYFCNIIQNQ